ncbi:pectinesterase family protein [Bacillus sonorensis]|nr:pectinesterase family protein [Bacillus sonorensis]
MNNRETAAVRLTVAKDGSGACKTVQEAVDALPEYSRERKEILIKKESIKKWSAFRQQSRLSP